MELLFAYIETTEGGYGDIETMKLLSVILMKKNLIIAN